MNQFWKDIGIAFIMGMIVPSILLAGTVSLTVRKPEVPGLTEPILITDWEGQSEPDGSQEMICVLHHDGQTEWVSLNEYLTCVVLAEMPVSFEKEALKAQAVVARTYTMRVAQDAPKHTDADVCTDSTCCQGYTDVQTFLRGGGSPEEVQYIRELVKSTDGLVLTYEDDLIEATYFSCSGGATEDAVAVWGTDVPYLQSVPSPGEENAAHYTDKVTFSASEFAAKLGLQLSGDPATWFSDVTYTDGGGVASMNIGGKPFLGTQLRKLLDLRSTAFTVIPDGDRITVQTRGYGHRVGMSQYGADAMAASGNTFSEILSYYYKGTELTKYTD